MFSPTRKTDSATPTPDHDAPAPRPSFSNGEATAPQPARNGGVLSSGVSIVGSVRFSNELLIDGQVEGEIHSSGRLTIGKHATIQGEIRTKSVTVHGTVRGNITAEERCELLAGCTVEGDVEAPRLVVDEEATFVGSAKITARQKPAQ